MRLFVIGATGKTGRHIVDLALSRGHTATAFVRSPHALEARPGLAIVKGDPLDATEMAAAMPGHHAVLFAIGAPPREALRPSTLMGEAGASTVAAMTRSGLARIALVSAAVLFDEPGLRFAFFRWLLQHHARDLGAMEALVAASELDYTIARPPRLVRSDETAYRASVGRLPEGGSVLSFRAVAAFMLDAVERDEHVRETVGIAR
ncbi:NAD(P)-dependent oxidoreductase [Sandaracinus amylolyticus]|uniref:NAD(P)-dependent oxidoreductase n=1 Tax=Sandaracinus amylolyticus TaxID=927083 RepID=UPI001F175961|nr:NAD(P)H-binding protein [Sandaracinus amylolyticus]UJR80998.1 Flavin reductase [Sandaracinus amylolyticus]